MRRSGRLPIITPWPDEPGVYAVEGAGGYIKIGRATNIRKRLNGIKGGSPVPLKLRAVLSDDPTEEGVFHHKWRHLRKAGEWFKLTPDLAEWLASLAPAEPEPAPLPSNVIPLDRKRRTG